MQSAVAQKNAMRSAVARPTARAARPSRAAVVVRASAESRRAVLSGFLATVALTAAKGASAAATPVDLFDDRKAKETGFDLIYEARDLDLPQSVRDGLTQARGSVESTLKRVKESEKRIDNELEPLVQKAYWTAAREELRNQVGTLRFDLNTLASAKGSKEAKKAALAARKDFVTSVEALDLALRKKDKDSALSKLSVAKASLDKALAAL